jgi:hypothetical protein
MEIEFEQRSLIPTIEAVARTIFSESLPIFLTIIPRHVSIKILFG